MKAFQSTPPVRGATRCGPVHSICCAYFNPRPPCGGRLKAVFMALHKTVHFNPRPPCGGRRATHKQQAALVAISIHAPRAGGDCFCRSITLGTARFQSTPPVRGATPRKPIIHFFILFQSTPPVRGATNEARRGPRPAMDFNPRPPCGGRQTNKPHRR